MRQDGSDPGEAGDRSPLHYVFPSIQPGGAISCPSLGLGVAPFAEVGLEPVVGTEAHVGRSGDDETGNGPTFETAHAIGEGRLGHAADVLEALGQSRHGGVGPQVVGEVDEADPAPGQHGAEDEQRTNLSPVEDHHVAGRPHPGTPTPVVLRPPLDLHLGHQPTQVPGRALIAGGPDDGQEALGRDLALGPCHPFGHHVPDGVVVVGHRWLETGLASGRRAPPS